MYRLMYRGSGRRFAEITPSKKKRKQKRGKIRERERKAREKSLPGRGPKEIEGR